MSSFDNNDLILNNKSILLILIEKFLENTNFLQKNFNLIENGTQTEVLFEKNLDEKLKEIDEKYKNSLKIEELFPLINFEEKMQKYKQETELRIRKDFEDEIRRFKEIESSNIRLEENRKYFNKIKTFEENLENEYNSKFENLKKREENLQQQTLLKEKEIERQKFELNQKFLSEIQQLKEKEDIFVKKYENDLQNLKNKEEKVNFKEKELVYIQDNSLNKLNEQIEQFKLEYDRKHETEKQEIFKRKLEIEEKEQKVKKIEDDLVSLKNSLKSLEKENLQSNREKNKLEEFYVNYKSENENVRNQFNLLLVKKPN